MYKSPVLGQPLVDGVDDVCLLSLVKALSQHELLHTVPQGHVCLRHVVYVPAHSDLGGAEVLNKSNALLARTTGEIPRIILSQHRHPLR